MRLRVSQTKWHNCNWQESEVPKLTGKKFPVQIGFISVNASFLVSYKLEPFQAWCTPTRVGILSVLHQKFISTVLQRHGQRPRFSAPGLNFSVNSPRAPKLAGSRVPGPYSWPASNWSLTLDSVKSLLTQVFFSNEEFCVCSIGIFPWLFRKKKFNISSCYNRSFMCLALILHGHLCNLSYPTKGQACII